MSKLMTAEDNEALREAVASCDALTAAAGQIETGMKLKGARTFGVTQAAEFLHALGALIVEVEREAEREGRVRRQWVADLQARGVTRHG